MLNGIILDMLRGIFDMILSTNLISTLNSDKTSPKMAFE